MQRQFRLTGQESKLGKGTHYYFCFFPTSDKVHKVIPLDKMPWNWLYPESGVGHLRKIGKRDKKVTLYCVGRQVTNEGKKRCCPFIPSSFASLVWVHLDTTNYENYNNFKLFFLWGKGSEGRNLVKISILRGTSQKSPFKRRAEMCMNLLAPVWAVN